MGVVKSKEIQDELNLKNLEILSLKMKCEKLNSNIFDLNTQLNENVTAKISARNMLVLLEEKLKDKMVIKENEISKLKLEINQLKTNEIK